MNETSSTVPGGDRESLEFTQQRVAAWTAAGANIGLAPEDIAAVTQTNGDATTALSTRLQKANEAKASTVTWHAAAATNRTTARELVRKIRFFATQQADPDAVYALAQIPPPKDREALPKPPVPTNLRVTLDTQGRAVLKFDGSRYGSTIFAVQRQTVPLAGQPGAWADVKTIQEREFTDTTTPAGVAGVNYRVRAERPVGVSAYSSPVGLPLGAGGNQQFVATSDQAVAGAIAPSEPSGQQAG